MPERSALLAVYRGLGYVAEPALRLLVAWRTRHHKEDAARRGERYGRPSAERPDGALIWVHAASVGETNAVLPLIGHLSAPGRTILLTTTTVTSAQIAERRLPEEAIHQYVPFDVVPAIRRFLDHWRPDLSLFVESEIWPAILSELDRRKVPRAIVNGRLSERSWQRWRKRPAVAAAIFGMVQLCLTQTEEDASRFGDLGVSTAAATGNLKFDGDPPPSDEAALAALATATAGRPTWIAASTHPGEDAIAVDVHQRLMPAFPGLLTLIAPRHPIRGADIADLVEARGIGVARRSQNTPVTADVGVYIADTIGEMGVFYRLAPIAFVGGSLVPFGGHNPIEPAQLNAALIAGPHVQNFNDIYRDLRQADAIITVEDAGTLAHAIAGLMDDGKDLARRAARAQTMVTSGRGALARTLDALQSLLPRTDGEGEA